MAILVVAATASFGMPLPPKVASGSGPKVSKVGVTGAAMAAVLETIVASETAAIRSRVSLW
ncbi:MAG: hypothetical protein MZW92_33570 [Comamonadaceae bacterium]|nr:hypothetical protein [Comamonadaceae bacterium]